MLKVNLWWLKQPCDMRNIHFDYTIELNKEEQASRMMSYMYINVVLIFEVRVRQGRSKRSGWSGFGRTTFL